jgi:hypothetical protein
LLDRPFNIRADQIIGHVADHGFWLSYLSRAFEPSSAIGLHLAIFTEPFLTLVLEGQKTTDSRFSKVRCAPFDVVNSGDVILIKEAGGPICGLALAKHTFFYELDRETVQHIREQYGKTICADEKFWRSCRGASYATLIELAETTQIPATNCTKRDRRAWVSLRSPQLQIEL